MSHTLNSFLHPFNNATDFLKGVHIVKNYYSEKNCNYLEVNERLNKIMTTSFGLATITSFVKQIRTYPEFYGYSYINNFHKFSSEIHQNFSSLNMYTLVITPEINFCIFCENGKLIVKAQFCEKNPILYSVSGIGKLFINLYELLLFL